MKVNYFDDWMIDLPIPNCWSRIAKAMDFYKCNFARPVCSQTMPCKWRQLHIMTKLDKFN